MSRAGLPYTPCKLFYDGGALVEVGHYLRTPAGSAYLVDAVRQNRNRPYRKHLQCLRWPVDEIPPGAVVHPLHWYRRESKRGHSLASLTQLPRPAGAGLPTGGTGQPAPPATVPDLDEWDQYEEDGPLDLEEHLERALDRAFPVAGKNSRR